MYKFIDFINYKTCFKQVLYRNVSHGTELQFPA